MLTLLADQPECLWDDVLPIEVRELPEDLAALDVLLSDPELLFPLVERWRQEFHETGRLVLTEGRPTIPLESYVRSVAAEAATYAGLPGGSLALVSGGGTDELQQLATQS